MNYLSNFLAMRNSTLPPSPQSLNNITECDLDETQLEKFNASSGKSFTIASILGLKKKSSTAMSSDPLDSKSKELNAINLTMHNSHSYQLQSKSSFNVVESENRFLQNRIPLAFAHHHLQSSSHAQNHANAAHFYQTVNNNSNNNNNNNNLLTVNHNGSSALQNLQHQFHPKNNQSFSSFHGKEQRTKNGLFSINEFFY